MENINWIPSFSVGVMLFDEQHKQSIDMINIFIAAPETSALSESISEPLDNLPKYAAIHFRAEEQLLEESGYPSLALQSEIHKAYRIKNVALCQAEFIHKDSHPRELLMFLRDWWVNHILETNIKYHSFLTECCAK